MRLNHPDSNIAPIISSLCIMLADPPSIAFACLHKLLLAPEKRSIAPRYCLIAQLPHYIRQQRPPGFLMHTHCLVASLCGLTSVDQIQFKESHSPICFIRLLSLLRQWNLWVGCLAARSHALRRVVIAN
jgi:hypothetical protein